MSTIKILVGLFVIAAIFFVLGLAYNHYSPLWNPPDEERHFIYCEYIAHNHKLPDYTKDLERNMVSIAFHPPLYYLIGSLFFKEDRKLLEQELTVNDGPGYNLIIYPKKNVEPAYARKIIIAQSLRLFSLSLGTLTVCLIYLIVLTIFPGNIILALTVTIFAATVPEFLYISAAISNDSLTITSSTAFILSLLYFIKYPRRFCYQFISGLFLGTCLLSKTLTIIYLPITLLFVIWFCHLEKQKTLQPLLIIFSVGLIISGWWYLRNLILFNDPLLSKTVEILNPWHLRQKPLSLNNLLTIIEKTFISFFGAFGAFQFFIPSYSLIIYLIITSVGITGISFLIFIKPRLNPYQVRTFFLLFLFVIGGIASYAYLNLKYVGMFLGRYLFIVIAPLALFIIYGLQSLFPQKIRTHLFISLSLLLILQNFFIIFKVLKPAYAETYLLEMVNQSTFCCTTPEISRSSTVSQTFIAPRNNLSAIRVMFSVPVKQKSGEIIFVLREEGEASKTLFYISYPVNKIEDTDRCCFIFPPIPDSRGKTYLFTFSAPAIRRGISLWYENKKIINGTLLFNGSPVTGSLYFQAYSFTGKKPETDWQGRRVTVINQGWYLGLRELQLYYERTKSFREKTFTHKKFEMLGKALQKRNVSY